MNNDQKVENVGIDREFIDEKGDKASLHIESANGYNTNISNLGKYKLANLNRKNDSIVKNKNGILNREISFGRRNGGSIFTKDIGFKSSGFAQIASLSLIVAIAGLFVMYLLFRF